MIRTMVIAGLVLLVAQIHRSAGGVLALELGNARGMAPAAIGTVISVMSLASALVQIPTGMLLDRFGVRSILSVLLLLGGIGTLWFALGETAGQLAVARVLIGVGFAAAMTSIFLLAMAWTSPERMGTVAAILVSIPGSIGAVLGTAPLSLAFASIGWTSTFIALSAVTLVLAVAVRLLVREGAQERTAGRREGLSDNLGALLDIVRHRDLQRITVMAFCFAGPFMAVGGLWAGPFLRDVHGLSSTAAGAVILILVVAYNSGTLVIGTIERRLGTRRGVVLGAAAVTILVYTTFAAFPTLPLPLALPLLVVSALAGPYFVILAAHGRSFVPADRAARMVTTMSLAGIGGTFFMQWATGLTVEALSSPDGTLTLASYRSVFALPAILLTLCCIVYIPVNERPARDHHSPPG